MLAHELYSSEVTYRKDNNSCRQVEVVVLAANLEALLAADEGEPLPEFQNQQSKMLY